MLQWPSRSRQPNNVVITVAQPKRVVIIACKQERPKPTHTHTHSEWALQHAYHQLNFFITIYNTVNPLNCIATDLSSTSHVVRPTRVQLLQIPPLYGTRMCTKEPGLKPNHPNHSKKVPNALKRWLLCSGNNGDKQIVTPDLSFAVEFKVFLLKNPWLSTRQTNKQIIQCMEPLFERSLVRSLPHTLSLLRPQSTIPPPFCWDPTLTYYYVHAIEPSDQLHPLHHIVEDGRMMRSVLYKTC